MDLDSIIKELSSEDVELSKKCTSISKSLYIYKKQLKFEITSYYFSGIISGTFSMISFIEKLDFLLTNTSPDQRELGVRVFADVLGEIPTDLLNTQQVELISTFFISKLKDHHKVRTVNSLNIVIANIFLGYTTYNKRFNIHCSV